MNLLSIVITLIVIGVLLWLEETFIPMNKTIKMIIRVLVIVAIVIWILQSFGWLGPISNIRIK